MLSPLENSFTCLVQTIVVESEVQPKLPQNVHGNFANYKRLSSRKLSLFLLDSSFDTTQKLWQPVKSLLLKMDYLSAIELNDSIYVAGHIDPAKKYPSNFWCYDSAQNGWIAKAHITYGYPYAFKMNRNICIFNEKAGFMIYDPATDHWNTVININLLRRHFSLKILLLTREKT